jgi:hypothetical protein
MLTTDDLNDEEVYIGDMEISSAEFRKYSGDLFYNVFLIFSANFGIEGENYFFSKFLDVLKEANSLNQQNKNEEYFLIVEVIIFFVRNLILAMNTDHHFTFIIQFMKTIMQGNSLTNEKILHSFILLIKEATNIIPIDMETFSLIIQFLSNLIYNTNLASIACEVLLSISKNLDCPNQECFKFCLKIFEEKQDSLSMESLLQFTESLCNIVAVVNKEIPNVKRLPDQEVFELFALVMKPSIIRIKSTYSQMMSNQFQEINKFNLNYLKSYGTINALLTKCFDYEVTVMENCFIVFTNETISFTEAIYKLLNKDTNFIREMNLIFLSIIKNMSVKAVGYFDKLNEIYASSYLSNSENLQSLEILGYLYSSVISYNNDKKQVVSKNFQFIGSRVLDNILSNPNNKSKIEHIETFANFVIRVTETINFLYIDKEFFDRMIQLYIEAIQKISEPSVNKTIIKLFCYLISFSSVFGPELVFPHFVSMIVTLFKCLKSFDTNICNEVLVL